MYRAAQDTETTEQSHQHAPAVAFVAHCFALCGKTHRAEIEGAMEAAGAKIFSLVVKIWVEDSGQVTWHGQVTHIPSGDQYYVNRPEDVAVIVSRHLAQFGIRPGVYLRMWQWYRRVSSAS